mmetsp:Transcript_28665/g.64222  ORF Transcript_28665/g.64222 Transcript_28665/m.64222 type:complete len:296 (-) Transcript_28665:590-1477(-)
MPSRRPTISLFITSRSDVIGTRYTRLLAGATVSDVPMMIRRSHSGRSCWHLTWNSFGRLLLNRTIVGFIVGLLHRGQSMGVDWDGASASSPDMSFMFVRIFEQNSPKSISAPQTSHAAAPIEPWTFTIFSLGIDVCSSRPSMFWVYHLVSLPSFVWSISTNLCASVALHLLSCVPSMKLRLSSRHGRGFSRNIPLSRASVGSSPISAWSSSLAVSNSGLRVSYRPVFADRKSGMPELTEMPAPARTTIDWHMSELMKSAISRNVGGFGMLLLGGPSSSRSVCLARYARMKSACSP